MDLTDKKVVVIGGSSGIGFGIAKVAAEAGARVVIVARDRDRAGSAARSLRGAVAAVADVSREDDIARLFADGPVDHVAITAAHIHYQRVAEMDLAGARRAVEAKVLGALAVAKHARFSPGGSLVLTSGINVVRPMKGAAAVVAANGALEALVRALALELAPVRVNAISPGWVDTPAWDVIAGEGKRARLADQGARLPVGRVGLPADLGQAAVFLMSNGFTTAEILHVDGGHPIV